MANKALAVLIGTVLDGIFRGFMAHRTKIATGGDQDDGCLVFFGGGLVAVLAAHGNCGMDKLALFLLGMAFQTCFRLDVLLFN